MKLIPSCLCVSTLCAGLAVAANTPQATPSVAPNVVYILADDMGCGDVSSYNSAAAWTTPNLDRLTQGGMRFTNAHSSSAVCTPSRYSILTGRYSWRSRLKAQVTNGLSAPVIEADRMTVADVLRAKGYSTAMIGKWHLGLDWTTTANRAKGVDLDPTDGEPAMRSPGAADAPTLPVDYRRPFGGGPMAHGFDTFFGISASLDMPPYVWLQNDRVPNPPSHTIPGQKGLAMWRSGPISDDFRHVDVLPRLTSEAVSYLRGQHGGKPFFLYLTLPAPHTPIVPAKEFAGRTKATPYGDFCVQVDAVVGEIMRTLKELHLDENTVVIFSADNGCSPAADFEALRQVHHDPQPGMRGAKADIYEGGHRVPFIARWPGRIAAGTTSDALVCEMDLMATCADLTASALPATAAEDSVSLLPILTGQTKGEVREALVHHSINGSFGIRQGDWKLCLCPDSGGWSAPKPGKAPAGSPPFQLFNLKTDPAETKNLYADHPEIVQRLGLLLKSYVLRGRSTPGPDSANTGGNSWPQLDWMKAFE